MKLFGKIFGGLSKVSNSPFSPQGDTFTSALETLEQRLTDLSPFTISDVSEDGYLAPEDFERHMAVYSAAEDAFDSLCSKFQNYKTDAVMHKAAAPVFGASAAMVEVAVRALRFASLQTNVYVAETRLSRLKRSIDPNAIYDRRLDFPSDTELDQLDKLASTASERTEWMLGRVNAAQLYAARIAGGERP